MELWREAFGQPDIIPAGAGQLPPELVSQLPDSKVTLGKLESYETAFEQLAKASGIEVVLHPEVKGEKVSGHLESLPVTTAWSALLRNGGFVTHFDGERLYIAKAPFVQPQPPGRSWAPTFDCPAR